MTVEDASPIKIFTVAGIGPYALPWPYFADSITVNVEVSGARIALTAGSMFVLDPLSSTTEGDLFLSPGSAATYDGARLVVERQTREEQGWLGVQGDRERGLEVQLDRLTMSLQELQAAGQTALRVSGVAQQPIVMQDGAVPAWDDAEQAFVSGPNADDIADAAPNAAAVAAAWLAIQGVFLGISATDPTVNLAGNALQQGAMYFNSVANAMKIYTGGAWMIVSSVDTGVLYAGNNLSDLLNATSARSNLGLVKQSAKDDATAGRVMTVGAFGLGAVSSPPELSSFNATDTAAGDYFATASTPGPNPFPGEGCLVEIKRYDGGKLVQIGKQAISPYARKERSLNAATWTPWKNIINEDELAAFAMPRVNSGTGAPGEITTLKSAYEGALVAPPGGSWFVQWLSQGDTTKDIVLHGVDIKSGGATVRGGTSNTYVYGSFWRLQ